MLLFVNPWLYITKLCTEEYISIRKQKKSTLWVFGEEILGNGMSLILSTIKNTPVQPKCAQCCLLRQFRLLYCVWCWRGAVRRQQLHYLWSLWWHWGDCAAPVTPCALSLSGPYAAFHTSVAASQAVTTALAVPGCSDLSDSPTPNSSSGKSSYSGKIIFRKIRKTLLSQTIDNSDQNHPIFAVIFHSGDYLSSAKL